MNTQTKNEDTILQPWSKKFGQDRIYLTNKEA